MNTALLLERFATPLVGLMLLLCTLTLFLTYPQVTSVRDETAYVRQASLFAAGKATLTQESTDGIVRAAIVSRYPAGTSLVMAPWIALFGWRGAFASSLASLFVILLVTAQWLRDQGLSPLVSIGMLLYPVTIASTRLAMSDLPCTALVTLALWQFWRARGGDWRPMFASGLLAGLSILFRENQVLVFAPFFLGSILRGDRKWPFALAGGLFGCSLRVFLSWLIFGNPLFYARPAEFSTSHLTTNLGWILFCMTILLPGGLIFPILYKGPRAIELRLSVYGLVVFHCFYDYFGLQSSNLKAVVLGGRFFLPICPLIMVAAAEVVSRLRSQLPSCSRADSDFVWRKLGASAAVALIIGASISILGVHWIMNRYNRADAAVIKAIYQNTTDRSVVLTNKLATDKWLNELYGDRIVGELSEFDRAETDELLQRKGQFYIVMLQRSDSEFWHREHEANRVAVAAILKDSSSVVLVDRAFGPTYRLWICRVQRQGRTKACNIYRGWPVVRANEREFMPEGYVTTQNNHYIEVWRRNLVGARLGAIASLGHLGALLETKP